MVVGSGCGGGVGRCRAAALGFLTGAGCCAAAGGWGVVAGAAGGGGEGFPAALPGAGVAGGGLATGGVVESVMGVGFFDFIDKSGCRGCAWGGRLNLRRQRHPTIGQASQRDVVGVCGIRAVEPAGKVGTGV